MRVILKVDVKGTGKKGDAVEVSDGYARNFLFPRKLAVEASAGAVRALEEEKNAQVRKQEKIITDLKTIRDRLDGQTVEVPAKCGDNGRLFGSITNKDIADAISRKLGKEFDKRLIDLSTPIKLLGTYPVTLKFGHNISGTVTVHITEA